MKPIQTTPALIIVLITTFSFGQGEVKRNTFFLEAGGNTFFYSLNYDRQLKVTEKWRLAGRVGVMYVNTFKHPNRNMFAIPIEFSYLRGKQSNFFEVGLGLTGFYDHYNFNDLSLPIRENQVSELSLMTVLRIGYRHQKQEGGLFYRFGFTPMAGVVIDLDREFHFQTAEKFAYPLVSAAIGWTLKG